MIYHSTLKEVHQYFPKLNVPENEGIYKLSDGSDKLAFVILPINGGKPIQVSNGYPQYKMDEEYIQVLCRYYKYPAERSDIDIHKSYVTRLTEMEDRYRLNNIKFKLIYTAILLTSALSMGFFTLLAQPPLYFWIIYGIVLIIWLIAIWKDRKGKDL